MVFNTYAKYYDLLYKDKNYVAESKYVDTLIKNNSTNAKHVLELGCGTGAHAEHLARMGYIVHGVDMSKEMLERAESRKANLPDDVSARMSFSLGDVRSVQIEKTFDVVISLFHVMSYQSTNDDLVAAFDTASKHLSENGLFLFDFWYGPAVLSLQPDTRVKRLEDSDIKVTRIAEPDLDINANLVDVNYDVFIEDKSSNIIEQLSEKHRMRYFFLPELKLYHGSSWKEIVSEEWLSGDSLSEDSWAGVQLLSRI